MIKRKADLVGFAETAGKVAGGGDKWVPASEEGSGGKASPAQMLIGKTPKNRSRARATGASNDEPAGAVILRAVRMLRGIGSAMPTPENLAQEIEDARNATRRGYFTPDEDERVRVAFAKFLRARIALEDTIAEIEELCSRRDGEFSILSEREQFQAFAVSFYAACLLNRTADFVVGRYGRSKVVHRKLDEPEPRFGIPKKCFTRLFNSLTEPRHIWYFQQLIRFANANQGKILALRDDPELAPIVELLLAEKPTLIEFSRRTYYRKRLRYWCYAIIRGQQSSYHQAMAALYELTGRAISNVRNPFLERRVKPETIAELESHLRPGDLLVTRHAAALVNYVVPGFWPHIALYIGTEAQRELLGVVMDDERRARSADPMKILDAKKDGVRFRLLRDTLHVDAFAVIRPKLKDHEIAEAIGRAVTHEGKDYDFQFDCRRADRLVCTELIYRAYHSVGGLEILPSPGIGRFFITPEGVLDHAVEGDGFEVVALFGTNGNGFLTGEHARLELIKSYRQDRVTG